MVSSLLDIGSSTVGACGDVSRNVMVTPAPFSSPPYVAARLWGKICAQIFRPMTGAFSTVWLDGEKAATVESWALEVKDEGIDVDKVRLLFSTYLCFCAFVHLFICSLVSSILFC